MDIMKILAELYLQQIGIVADVITELVEKENVNKNDIEKIA